MPRTDDLSLPQYHQAFIYGDFGVGKTRLLATAEKPVYIFDCDRGIRTLSGVPGIEYDTFWVTDKQRDGLATKSMLLRKIESLRKDCPYKTVALDSSTFLSSNILIPSIITVNNRWGKDPEMRLEDWGTLSDELEDIFLRLLSLPCNVYVTGHGRIDVSEETKTVLYLIMNESGRKFPQKVSGIFDEVYRMYSVPHGGQTPPTYHLQTRSDIHWIAKTRMNFYDQKKQEIVSVLNMIEEPDLSKIVNKLAKARQGPVVENGKRKEV